MRKATGRGCWAWLDARHRSHVHVEGNLKQAKALGMNRWPSRAWSINVAWTQIVPSSASDPCAESAAGERANILRSSLPGGSEIFFGTVAPRTPSSAMMRHEG